METLLILLVLFTLGVQTMIAVCVFILTVVMIVFMYKYHYDINELKNDMKNKFDTIQSYLESYFNKRSVECIQNVQTGNNDDSMNAQIVYSKQCEEETNKMTNSNESIPDDGSEDEQNEVVVASKPTSTLKHSLPPSTATKNLAIRPNKLKRSKKPTKPPSPGQIWSKDDKANSLPSQRPKRQSVDLQSNSLPAYPTQCQTSGGVTLPYSSRPRPIIDTGQQGSNYTYCPLRSRRNNPQLKKKKDVPVKPFESPNGGWVMEDKDYNSDDPDFLLPLHQGGIEQTTFQEEASCLVVSLPPPSDILRNTVTDTDGVPPYVEADQDKHLSDNESDN